MNTASTATESSGKSSRSDFALDRQTLVLLAISLAILTLALYLPAVRNGFVNYDDPDYVTRNAHVMRGLRWENVVWAFGTNNPAANWHPLTWISHMVDVKLFGLNPWGHHLTNVLLMAVDISLLFLFLAGATGQLWRSAAVAALFAVHPLNVEGVAWVAERKQVLSLFFMFLSLIAYVLYVKRLGFGRYLLVATLFACALMSKVMIITLPFTLLLFDYWPLDRFFSKREGSESPPLLRTIALVREKVPLFLLAIAAGVITLRIHRKEGALSAAMPIAWRLKNTIYTYAVYLWKAIWPTNLSVFYPHPENRLPLWQVGIAALMLLLISALAWRYREKKYLTVGWLWYLGTAFPMIGLVQSGRQGMADRYADLPLLGAFVAIVWLAADGLERWKLSPALAGAGFACILLPLAFLTHQQISFWKDSETLFSHAVQMTSRNGTAENNLGAALMEKGDASAAFPHFQAAVQYAPDLGSAHYNLAVILHRQNQLPEAAAEYRLAIAYAEDAEEAAQAHNNLGALYLGLNNMTLAKAEFDKAISLNPNEVNSYLARGTIEFSSGKLDDAIADFTQVNARASSPLAFYWLGRAEQAKGDFARAKMAYLSALQLAPNMREARAQLESLRTLAEQ